MIICSHRHTQHNACVQYNVLYRIIRTNQTIPIYFNTNLMYIHIYVASHRVRPPGRSAGRCIDDNHKRMQNRRAEQDRSHSVFTRTHTRAYVVVLAPRHTRADDRVVPQCRSHARTVRRTLNRSVIRHYVIIVHVYR